MKRFLLKISRIFCMGVAIILLFFPILLPGFLLFLASRANCAVRGWHRILFQNPTNVLNKSAWLNSAFDINALEGTRVCEDCNKSLADKEYDVALDMLKKQFNEVEKSLSYSGILSALTTALSKQPISTDLN